VGPPPHPVPAVHRYSSTALHWAAEYGNRRIVRSLVDADADVNAQDDYGCAVCARGESAVECAGRAPAAVGRAGTRRCTMPRTVAVRHASRSCCCAAPTGPSRTKTGTAALRRTAETEKRNGRARAGTRRSDSRNGAGGSRTTRQGRARCTSARRLTAAPLPSPNAAGADGCAVGVRRRHSPIQRAGRRRSTPTVIHALAARLAVHCITGGSKCRARRARAAALIGSAKCARARSTVTRTATGLLTSRGDRHGAYANTRAARRSAEFAFRPLSRRI
jgi:hypothetical protein